MSTKVLDFVLTHLGTLFPIDVFIAQPDLFPAVSGDGWEVSPSGAEALFVGANPLTFSAVTIRTSEGETVTQAYVPFMLEVRAHSIEFQTRATSVNVCIPLTKIIKIQCVVYGGLSNLPPRWEIHLTNGLVYTIER